MLKAVLFDLDGVVVDSEPAWFETYSQLLKNYGFVYTKKLDLELARGYANSPRNIVNHFGVPEKYPEFKNSVREIYKKLFFEKVALMPGITNLLERLKPSYKLALASSAYQYRVEYNFEKFPKLKDYFEATVTGDEVEKSKPAPDIFLLAAERLKTSPKSCLVIEDAPSGVEAAKAARMFCIGLLDTGPNKQDLSLADKQVEGLNQITEKLISSF